MVVELFEMERMSLGQAPCLRQSIALIFVRLSD